MAAPEGSKALRERAAYGIPSRAPFRRRSEPGSVEQSEHCRAAFESWRNFLIISSGFALVLQSKQLRAEL